MVYRLFKKKIGSGAIVTSKAGVNVNEMLAQELYKPLTKISKTGKVYARFKDNIWASGLPEMGSLSPKNVVLKYL